MISDDDAEKAVDFLYTSAKLAAKARADRTYVETYLKTVLADEMAKHGGESLGVQEREARRSPTYLAALQAMREAVEADERMRFFRQAAEAKVQAWQTFSANERATRI